MNRAVGILITFVLVLGLAGAASGYILRASAKDSYNMLGTAALQFGDPRGALTPQPPDGLPGVGLALPEKQDWLPGGDSGQWGCRFFLKPGPPSWKIALWASDFWQSTAHVRFYIQFIGNDGDRGTNIAGQVWQFTDLSNGRVLWQGMTDAAKNSEANPWIDLWLPVVNTLTPNLDAAPYLLAPVPESSAVLALLYGLGLLAGLRRRGG